MLQQGRPALFERRPDTKKKPKAKSMNAFPAAAEAAIQYVYETLRGATAPMGAAEHRFKRGVKFKLGYERDKAGFIKALNEGVEQILPGFHAWIKAHHRYTAKEAKKDLDAYIDKQVANRGYKACAYSGTSDGRAKGDSTAAPSKEHILNRHSDVNCAVRLCYYELFKNGGKPIKNWRELACTCNPKTNKSASAIEIEQRKRKKSEGS